MRERWVPGYHGEQAASPYPISLLSTCLFHTHHTQGPSRRSRCAAHGAKVPTLSDAWSWCTMTTIPPTPSLGIIQSS